MGGVKKGDKVRIDEAVERQYRMGNAPQPDYNALYTVTDTDGDLAIVTADGVMGWIVKYEALKIEAQPEDEEG